MKVRIYLNGNDLWDEEVWIVIELPCLPRKDEKVELSRADLDRLESRILSNFDYNYSNYDCFYHKGTHERHYNGNDDLKMKNKKDWYIELVDFDTVRIVSYQSFHGKYIPCIELCDPDNIL